MRDQLLHVEESLQHLSQLLVDAILRVLWCLLQQSASQTIMKVVPCKKRHAQILDRSIAMAMTRFCARILHLFTRMKAFNEVIVLFKQIVLKWYHMKIQHIVLVRMFF